MTRLLREHPAIEVETDASGRLSAIRWNGRREPVEVCNRWRVEEAWWGEPIARDYVKVVGRQWLALIYLDRVAGTWHLERLYDEARRRRFRRRRRGAPKRAHSVVRERGADAPTRVWAGRRPGLSGSANRPSG